MGVVILLCPGALRPDEARAWELATGRIKTMVESNGKVLLTVLIDSRSKDSQSPATTKEITTPSAIDLEIPREELPPRLKEGDLIRIWNQIDNPHKPVRISYSRGYDPTGVRSRLSGRSRRTGTNRSSGKGSHGGH